MKIRATHFIQIKEVLERDKNGKPTKYGKDLFLARRGDEVEVTKAQLKLLEEQAKGKFVIIEEAKVEGNKTK